MMPHPRISPFLASLPFLLMSVAVISSPGRDNSAPASPDELRSSLLLFGSIPPQDVVLRTAILNTLVEKYQYQSYLEIGQALRQGNLDWIECRTKIGVDPESSYQADYQLTSDEFFALNKDSFDLIFIDGLHRAGQVERDIINALKCLEKNGTIVVHDCNPRDEAMQRVPREGQGMWTGDVWKAWVRFRATRPDLKMVVVNADFGCGIIRRGRQKTIRPPGNLSYEVLALHRERLLNLIDVEAFVAGLKSDMLFLGDQSR